MSKLSTHVLDLYQGAPATGVELSLYYEDPFALRLLVGTAKTNRDGRTDAPLLSGDAVKVGIYELVFHIGAYFQSKKVVLPTPPFLDLVPVRFGISDPALGYHVPLLVSPWGYSTYRGS